MGTYRVVSTPEWQKVLEQTQKLPPQSSNTRHSRRAPTTSDDTLTPWDGVQPPGWPDPSEDLSFCPRAARRPTPTLPNSVHATQTG
jgi:hypothetical protein